MNNFRELSPIELWSAQILSTLDKESFANILSKVAEEEAFTFFGYFVVNGLAHLSTEYHFTRYPRRKYGIESIQRCNEMLSKLFQKLSMSDHHAEACIEAFPSQARVILGLVEGYNQNNRKHSIAEVKTALACSKFEIKAAEIHTRGPDRFYSESAAVILSSPKNIHAIYHLAESFKQERFTVENFPTQQAYVVETKYTKQPDEK